MGTELHPCFGPDHAQEHDDTWCLDCDRAWMGSDWQEERVGRLITELRAEVVRLKEVLNER